MTDAPRRPPNPDARVDREKRGTLLELLDRDEGLVAIHLDARRPGVSVPPHLQGELALRLDIAYGFNLPHLEIDDEGVEATLSFGGRNFLCFLPWHAIFSLSRPRHEGEGFVWPESLPPELRGPMAAALAGPDPAPAAQAAGAKRGPLATIPPAPPTPRLTPDPAEPGPGTAAPPSSALRPAPRLAPATREGQEGAVGASVEATPEPEDSGDTPKRVRKLALAPRPEAQAGDGGPPEGRLVPAPPRRNEPAGGRPALRLVRDEDA